MLNTLFSCGCVHYGKVWLSLLSTYQIYNLNVTSYQPWIGNDWCIMSHSYKTTHLLSWWKIQSNFRCDSCGIDFSLTIQEQQQWSSTVIYCTFGCQNKGKIKGNLSSGAFFKYYIFKYILPSDWIKLLTVQTCTPVPDISITGLTGINPGHCALPWKPNACFSP